MLLREDPENKLALMMGFKGRGDDDVLSRRQAESLCHLPQVDVGLAFRFGGRVEEEVLLQVLIPPAHLQTTGQNLEAEKVIATQVEFL